VSLQDAIELNWRASSRELLASLQTSNHMLVVHEDSTPFQTETGLFVLACQGLQELPEVVMAILAPSRPTSQVRRARGGAAFSYLPFSCHVCIASLLRP